MTCPLIPSEGGRPSLASLFIEASKTSFPTPVDGRKADFFKVFDWCIESLNFCSDLKLRKGEGFHLPTLSLLLDLTEESDPDRYLEMTPCVILIETIVEKVVEQGGIERWRAVARDSDREQEEKGRKLCQQWSSIFQVERLGRPWRIFEEQTALWRDVSLANKIQETAAYKRAHLEVFQATDEQYLNLARRSLAQTNLLRLKRTEEEVEKKELSQEFFSLLKETEREVICLDSKTAFLEKEVKRALRSEERVFIKERIRIIGEEAEARIKGEGLGNFSKVVEGAIKTIFDNQEINQSIQTLSEGFFFESKAKIELFEERGRDLFSALLREGFVYEGRVESCKTLEFEWRETSRKINSIWAGFHNWLSAALTSCLDGEKFFDAIKGDIGFDSFNSTLTASLETILVNFIKQGFFEALEMFKKEAGVEDDSVVGDFCKMQL